MGFDSPEGEVVQANEGHLRFTWATDSALPVGATYVFQRSRSPEFMDPVELYRGPDKGTHVSGLAGGTYYFRVYLEDASGAGPYGPILAVEVDYVDRARVTILMLVGFIVFLCTVGMVIGGHLRTRSKGGAPA